MDAVTGGVRNYLDFSGMSDLKVRAQNREAGALRETAQQFEAYFLQQMLGSMRTATVRGGLFDSETTETFEGMLDRELAVAMSRRGALGFADQIEQVVARTQRAVPAADVLSARAAMALNPGSADARPLDARKPAMSLGTDEAIPVLPLERRTIYAVPAATQPMRDKE